MSEVAATQRPATARIVPVATARVERCPATGITKPECHCPACLAALVAHHHRRSERS